MGFRKELQKKIRIKQLARRVMGSINPADGTQRIDKAAMQKLVELGPYVHRELRDLDLYSLDDQKILVLDNELKIYNTTAEDIALRKSPTVKEMISIRNAIKILNDKDVVVSRKGETVERVQMDLINGLDLSYDPSDIESLARDGIKALEDNDAQAVIQLLSLFAELLDYQNAPKALSAAGHHIWGRRAKSKTGAPLFGPGILFDPVRNRIKLCKATINSTLEPEVARFDRMVKGDSDADLSDADVFSWLQTTVLEKPHSTKK